MASILGETEIALGRLMNLARYLVRNTNLASARRIHTRIMALDMKTKAFPNEQPPPYPAPELWPAAKVRDTFVKYFTEARPGLEHTFWPSSSVIPFEDPTLLFANAVSRQCHVLSDPWD